MRTSPMLFRRCTVTYQWYYWHSIFSNDLKNPSYNNSECVRINRYLLYMWTMTFQGRVSKTCRHKYVSKEMQPPSIVLQCTQNNNQRIQCINWSRVLDIRSSKQLSSCSVHGVTQLLSSGARLIPWESWGVIRCRNHVVGLVMVDRPRPPMGTIPGSPTSGSSSFMSSPDSAPAIPMQANKEESSTFKCSYARYRSSIVALSYNVVNSLIQDISCIWLE